MDLGVTNLSLSETFTGKLYDIGLCRECKSEKDVTEDEILCDVKEFGPSRILFELTKLQRLGGVLREV